MTDTTKRNRVLFWVLVAIFFGPLALSFTWYYAFDDIRPAPEAQHGNLVLPPRPLPQASLPTPDGETAPDFLTGHWSLVYFGPGDCDDACRRVLLDLRQLRLALGRERVRIQQVFMHTGEPPDAAWLEQEMPMLLVAHIGGATADTLLAEFHPGGRDALTANDTVYLVDPLGNLMMTYGTGRTQRGMHDDLKRLLRLSHIG